MASLGDYLELTPAEARGQWGRILRRVPRPRQETFTPVEVILCYGLFFIVDPSRYGGANVHRAPEIVHELGRLFARTAASVTAKMANLDGSRRNAGKYEWQVFAALGNEPERFARLYNVALEAARDMGVDATRLPDFLGLAGRDRVHLLGQEELDPTVLERVVDEHAVRYGALREITDVETTRMAESNIRLGQNRFANQVLDNYGHACGFCGFAPHSLRDRGLLIASHIKPWAESDDRERLDHRNGVAACPTHDAAFDAGLITVNGGLHVHRAPALENSVATDPGVDVYFREHLSATLRVPDDAASPSHDYLTWHHDHVYRGTLATNPS